MSSRGRRSKDRTASKSRAVAAYVTAEASRQPEVVPGRWRSGLLAIGIGAFAFRLFFLWELRDTPLFSVLVGDGRQYDEWALRIAGGQWIGTEVFYQTPLYPYVMAAVYALVGHAVGAVRLLQAALGAAGCVLLAMAGRRFVDARAGLAAGALLAVYPPAIFFDALIQKSSLDAFFVSLLLFALARVLGRPRWPWLLLVGAALAVFMLNRENARVLYPVVVLWLLLAFRPEPIARRAGWVLAVTAATLALLLPVGIRNYHVGGEFLISTSQLGPNFYIGNHRGASGAYEPLIPGRGSPEFERADATRLAEQATGRTLTPGEVSDYWVGQATAFIRSEPGAWLALLGRKLMLVVNAREVVDTESVEGYALYSRLLGALLWFDFGIVLPLAAVGVWQTRRAWRRLSILYGCAATYALAVALFYVVGRYRFPIVPIVMVLAGAGVVALAGQAARIIGRASETTAGVSWTAALVGLLTAAVSNVPMRAAGDDTLLNVGKELVAAGRPAEALPVLERAAAAEPNYAPAHFNLGVALSRTGNAGAALERFRSAVRLRPDYPEAQAALALALEESGDLTAAIDHFREAVRLNSGDSKAAFNLANALVEAKRPAEALAHYEAAIRLNPAYAEAYANLALALRSMDRDPDALPLLREAARLQPGSAVIRFSLADLLDDLGRADEAMTYYRAAADLAPDSLEMQYSLAQACARAGRWPDALSALERSLALARAQGVEPAVGDIEAAMADARARMATRR